MRIFQITHLVAGPLLLAALGTGFSPSRTGGALGVVRTPPTTTTSSTLFRPVITPISSLYSSEAGGESKDEEVTPSAKNEASSDKPQTKKFSLEKLENLGDSFKPKAQAATAKAYQAETWTDQLLLTLQICLYYTLFMIYRGYRGFFVLLPAVFRQVYARLETAVDYELADYDDTTGAVVNGSSSSEENSVPKKTKWRTRITVSILAAVVTVQYVVSGLLRLAWKFVQALVNTKSVPQSFAAASKQVEKNEDMLLSTYRNSADDEDAINPSLAP